MNIELDFRKIGNKIQEVRNQKGLTQEQLAEMVGTSQKYISRIEVGYHNVKLDTIVAIARALCVGGCIDSRLRQQRRRKHPESDCG